MDLHRDGVGASDEQAPARGQVFEHVAIAGLVARGAEMIEYWHWNTLRYGAETYWGGVLPHSDRPGRAYRELAALGAEIEAAGGLVAGVTPETDVTMLQSLRSKWLMQEHPPLATRTWEPDPDSYHGLFDPFYRAPAAVPGKGVGLGLAVAKGFVEAMGGTIAAVERAGGGTVFRLSFPAHLLTEAAGEEAALAS